MPPNGHTHHLTGLLLQWQKGTPGALDELMPLVYDELRRVARHYLRGERAGHTLQATALVNEAYLRLVEIQAITPRHRAQFLALSARVMRRILIDHARRKRADKRGAGRQTLSLDEASTAAPVPPLDLLALDEALEQLSAFDERECRVVELKFFAGLTIDDIADVLGISTATVEREWAIAKAWLYHRLSHT